MTEKDYLLSAGILELIAFFGFLIFLYFAVCSPKKVEASPVKGEWICWINSIKNSSCGTFGWHKVKKVAFKAAEDKCVSHCRAACQLDYCELIK